MVKKGKNNKSFILSSAFSTIFPFPYWQYDTAWYKWCSSKNDFRIRVYIERRLSLIIRVYRNAKERQITISKQWQGQVHDLIDKKS